MQRRGTRTTRGTGRRIGRATAYGVGGFAALAVVLLFVTPSALAAPISTPTRPIVLVAPYTGTTVGYSNSWSQSGCGSAAILEKAFFHARSGLAGFDDRTKSPACSGNPLGASAWASSGMDIDFPVHVAHKALTIVAVTTIDAAMRAALSPGSCTSTASDYSCYAYADASLSGGFYLYDQTTGFYWFATSLWPGEFLSAYNLTSCYAGNCSSYSAPSESAHVDSTVVWTISATGLTPSDQFVLIAFFSSYTSASESSYAATTSGGTLASVNAALGGNGIDVDSITIV